MKYLKLFLPIFEMLKNDAIDSKKIFNFGSTAGALILITV